LQGEEGLKDRSRRPKRIPNKMNEKKEGILYLFHSHLLSLI